MTILIIYIGLGALSCNDLYFFDISYWTKVILEFNINHFESHSGPNHISLYAKTNYDLECYACIPLWAT